MFCTACDEKIIQIFFSLFYWVDNADIVRGWVIFVSIALETNHHVPAFQYLNVPVIAEPQ